MPRMTVSDQFTGETTPAAGEAYDIAAIIAALPTFSTEQPTFPTSPTITSEATVTSLSEFNASINVSGRRTIVPAETTIDIGSGTSITGTDTELVILGEVTSAGEVLNLNTPTRHRMMCAGSGILTAPFFGQDWTDVIFWGVRTDTEGLTDAQNVFYRCTRAAIVHCDIRSNQYAMFPFGPNADLFVMNTRFMSGYGQSVQRNGSIAGSEYISQVRGVWCDNYFKKINQSHHTWRIHEHFTDIVFDRNTTDDGGLWITPNYGGGSYSGNSEYVWFRDNKIYQDPGGPGVFVGLTVGAYPLVQNLVATGNEQYTEKGTFLSADTTWTVSDNTVGSQAAAPAWSQLSYDEYPTDYASL